MIYSAELRSERVPEIFIDGEGLDKVKSVTQLIGEKRVGRRASAFSLNVRGLADLAPRTLIARVGTTEDPLLLWAIHLELDRRDIAPCLRSPQADDAAPQLAYCVFRRT